MPGTADAVALRRGVIDLFVLAFALAMDATAAAAGIGAGTRAVRPVLAAACVFGLFQATMAGIGWWGGVALGAWLDAWDHFVAFGLLAAIGLSMIREGFRGGHDEPAERGEPGVVALLGVAVATSLDALAAGVTLPLLGLPAAGALVAIGATTAGMSLTGGLVGRALGARFGPALDVVGGVVLVGLGVKILVEHGAL